MLDTLSLINDRRNRVPILNVNWKYEGITPRVYILQLLYYLKIYIKIKYISKIDIKLKEWTLTLLI